MMDITTTLFSGLGLVTSTYLSLRFLRFIWLYIRPSSLSQYHYGDQPWALVTGASNGIGLGFARELALHSFNVILHGRNPSKLSTVKSTLESEFPAIQFRVLTADASTATNQDIADLVASVEDLNLTVLVNNVGGGVKVQPLAETSAEDVDSAININARFPAQLTRAFMPRFASGSGRTLIMNIGSGAHSIVPYATIYGGSKAFDMAMSSSLCVEMKAEGLDKKIEFLGVSVGKVTEASNNTDPVSFFTPGGRGMAKAALNRVGCGRPIVVGHFGHAVQIAILEALPGEAAANFVIPVMKMRLEEERKKN